MTLNCLNTYEVPHNLSTDIPSVRTPNLSLIFTKLKVPNFQP